MIDALSAEFFAGEGARDVARTIFVVGDEKQSIYSFQGADPEEFGARRRTSRRRSTPSATRCSTATCSTRSARRRRSCAWSTGCSGRAGEGLDAAVAHHAYLPRRTGPAGSSSGRSCRSRAARRRRCGTTRATPAAPDDPVERLAGGDRRPVAGWLDAGRALPGEDRAIRAGDVMVLVQRRGSIFDAVIRELKRAGVPVAGADVLRIGGELAVNDLLAALRFAATPATTCRSPAFLRSPLGGLSERELFELAHGRTGPRPAPRDALPAALPRGAGPRRHLRAQADFLRPFELSPGCWSGTTAAEGSSRASARGRGRRRRPARPGARLRERRAADARRLPCLVRSATWSRSSAAATRAPTRCG